MYKILFPDFGMKKLKNLIIPYRQEEEVVGLSLLNATKAARARSRTRMSQPASLGILHF